MYWWKKAREKQPAVVQKQRKTLFIETKMPKNLRIKNTDRFRWNKNNAIIDQIKNPSIFFCWKIEVCIWNSTKKQLCVTFFRTLEKDQKHQKRNPQNPLQKFKTFSRKQDNLKFIPSEKCRVQAILSMLSRKIPIAIANVQRSLTHVALHVCRFVERRIQLWLVDLVDALGDGLAVQFAILKVGGLRPRRKSKTACRFEFAVSTWKLCPTALVSTPENFTLTVFLVPETLTFRNPAATSASTRCYQQNPEKFTVPIRSRHAVHLTLAQDLAWHAAKELINKVSWWKETFRVGCCVNINHCWAITCNFVCFIRLIFHPL